MLVLSAIHATWTHELTSYVLHHDARFRSSQSWDSTRVPTRLEIVQEALRKGDGRVSVDALVALVFAHYGEPMSRGSLGAVAMHVGANLVGDWVLLKA